MLLAGLAACVSVNSTVLDPARQFAPVPRDSVRIFTSEDRIPGDYLEVALLFAEGDENWTSPSDMLNEMREKAGELGANGVLLRDLESPGTVDRVLEAVLGADARRRGAALAIRWGRALPDSARRGADSPDPDSAVRSDTAGAGRAATPGDVLRRTGQDRPSAPDDEADGGGDAGDGSASSGTQTRFRPLSLAR